MRFLFLRVSGRGEFPLGSISGPTEIPELLRHVADYYDDNPDACASHYEGDPGPPLAQFSEAGRLYGSS